MAGVIVDTSVWIDFFGGIGIAHLEEALAAGAAIIPPLVVAELISGASTPTQRATIGELLQDAPVHDTLRALDSRRRPPPLARPEGNQRHDP